LADGVQCNGTPTYSAYSSLTPSPLLFFDTRTNGDMLTTPERIVARSENLAKRPIHLVFSGRLKLMKGVNHLPLVADHLRKLGVPFKMSICGDGEYLPQLKKDVRKLGLDCITLRGTLDFETELLPFVANEADLFVCCHPRGDPSCTYLETMACGVPIVGYDNEALTGLVQASGVGWTTPLNDPKALAVKIASLKPRDLTIAANQSFSFAADHTFEKTFQRRIDHLDRVASARLH
jgi:glycosyltransferase involved in cell wall biosynthesis